MKRERVDAVLLSDACNLLRDLDSESVPLIVADPPYGIGYHSGYYRDKNPFAPVVHDWNFQIAPFLQESERVLIDGGAMYLFCRWDVLPLWSSSVAACGLKMKTKVVWVKDNWSAGDLFGCFGNQYEEILFITKGRHKLRGKRWSNVWYFPRIPAKKLLCPTQKPVALLMRAITASSDSGDLVVDPFMGSGSTAVAAMDTGRDYLVGDIDPRMVRLTRKRLGLATEPEPLRDTISHSATMTMPTPDEWGLHPEELRYLYDELRDNVTRNLDLPATIVSHRT